MKKTVIFDLDGTLLDTIPDLANACNYALKALKMPQITEDETKKLIGFGIKNLVEKALGDMTFSKEALMLFSSYYSSHLFVKTVPYEGVKEVLDELKKRGYLLAVLSNKRDAFTKKIIEHFFPSCFDFVLGERENLSRKPDKEMGEFLFNELKDINLEETFYVGDSPSDMKFARNLNVKGIAVFYGYRTKEQLLEEKPFFSIESPSEILNVLK